MEKRRGVLDLVQDDRRAFSLRNPMGSSMTLPGYPGSQGNEAVCSLELSDRSVVFPDCLGPVTSTAGNVFMAFAVFFPGFWVACGFLSWPNLNYNFKFGKIRKPVLFRRAAVKKDKKIYFLIFLLTPRNADC